MDKDEKKMTIEEMEKIINEHCRIIADDEIAIKRGTGMVELLNQEMNELLSNIGYRKIADDEIVLKFDDLVKRDEKIKEFAKNKVTKKTVRDILQIVDGKLDLYRNGVIGGTLYDAGYKNAVNEIKIAVKNKYGIELE